MMWIYLQHAPASSPSSSAISLIILLFLFPFLSSFLFFVFLPQTKAPTVSLSFGSSVHRSFLRRHRSANTNHHKRWRDVIAYLNRLRELRPRVWPFPYLRVSSHPNWSSTWDIPGRGHCHKTREQVLHSGGKACQPLAPSQRKRLALRCYLPITRRAAMVPGDCSVWTLRERVGGPESTQFTFSKCARGAHVLYR